MKSRQQLSPMAFRLDARFAVAAAMLNSVDMSRWGGPLSLENAKQMVAMGIRLLIVGTGNPYGAGLYANQQAETWLAAGGEFLDAYIYLDFAGDPRTQVAQALDTLTELPIRRWWLDAEDTASPQVSSAARGAFIDMAAHVLGTDRKIGIYTGRWWWNPYMAGTSDFADYPLWDSYYTGDPTKNGLPYGGWAVESGDPEIIQYQGTTTLCGQSVDLNYARLDMALTPDQINTALQARMLLERMAGRLNDIAKRPDLTETQDAIASLSTNPLFADLAPEANQGGAA